MAYGLGGFPSLSISSGGGAGAGAAATAPVPTRVVDAAAAAAAPSSDGGSVSMNATGTEVARVVQQGADRLDALVKRVKEQVSSLMEGFAGYYSASGLPGDEARAEHLSSITGSLLEAIASRIRLRGAQITDVEVKSVGRMSTHGVQIPSDMGDISRNAGFMLQFKELSTNPAPAPAPTPAPALAPTPAPALAPTPAPALAPTPFTVFFLVSRFPFSPEKDSGVLVPNYAGLPEVVVVVDNSKHPISIQSNWDPKPVKELAPLALLGTDAKKTAAATTALFTRAVTIGRGPGKGQ